MRRVTVFILGAAILGLAPAARAEDRSGNDPHRAPPGGFLLSDLLQFSSAAMMQAQQPHAPALGPVAPPSSWSLSGFAEFAYTYNFNRPDNLSTGAGDLKENNFRVFDVNHNEFSIHHVQLDASKAATDASPVGFRVVAMAGQDAKFIHSAGLFDPSAVAPTGTGEDFDLVDAYLTVKIPEKLCKFPTHIKLGKWETHHGAEVIHGPKNAHYSRSYLFGFAIPFTHTGIMVDTEWVPRPEGKGELFGTGFGWVNGWDNVKDNNDAKSWMGEVRFQPCDAFKADGAIMVGPEQINDEGDWRGLIDLNATVTVPQVEGLEVVGNYDYGWEDGAAALTGHNANWYGFAAYVKYDLKKCALLKDCYAAFRGEWFNDPDGARTGLTFGGVENGAEFIGLTGTFGYRPWEQLLVRMEYRYDKADHEVFEERGNLKSFQNTVAVNVIVFY